MAVVLYESSSDASDYQSWYQEGFVLIKASSLEEAKEKALNYAKREQVSYQNEYKETITWSLKRLVDVNNVLDLSHKESLRRARRPPHKSYWRGLLYDEFEDGTEIYARHFQNYEAYKQLDL